MLGEHANALVNESWRSTQTQQLLGYNNALVRSVVREAHSLSDTLETAVGVFEHGAVPDDGTSTQLTMTAIALQRNKRAVVVYHHQRMQTIVDTFWRKGGIVSAAFGAQTETRKRMTPQDERFAKGYADLCLRYKTSFLGEQDEDDDDDDDEPVQIMDATELFGSDQPPRDVFVSVRCLQDIGDVETASGARLSLNKGSLYYVAREDVENLITLGAVEIVD